MEGPNKETVIMPGIVTEKPAGGVKSIKQKVDALTSTMRERYFQIYPVYGEAAYEIVIHVKSKRTKGVWDTFLQRSKSVNASSGELCSFYKEVILAFVLTEQYSEYDIVKTIIDVRKKLGMEPLTEDITDACMEIFKLLYLSIGGLTPNDDGGGEHQVYTPNIALLVQ